MEYAITFTSSADRSLRRLDEELQRRIVTKVNALAIDPRPPGALKMAGGLPLWRIRIGSYRMINEIHDDQLVVLVLRVSHRKDAYRGM